jgi:A/G-specific adenine glycosylase
MVSSAGHIKIDKMSQSYVEFQEIVWDYYHGHGRDLSWREAEPDGTFDPYKILVSEIMLQQTQAARVIPKYEQFLNQFPDVKTLAQATQQAVLVAWSGLGYNRRARFLHQAARAILTKHDGVVPDTENELVALPGIGVNTARAVLAYAFNQPVTFIETNIRTVYIYHFFENQELVHDTEISGLVEQTINKEHPREWYWALMDYGSHLKATVGNLSRQSKHYTKQSTFNGSKRQVRGMVLKVLTKGPVATVELAKSIDDPRLEEVTQDLVKEGLVIKTDGMLSL